MSLPFDLRDREAICEMPFSKFGLRQVMAAHVCSAKTWSIIVDAGEQAGAPPRDLLGVGALDPTTRVGIDFPNLRVSCSMNQSGSAFGSGFIHVRLALPFALGR